MIALEQRSASFVRYSQAHKPVDRHLRAFCDLLSEAKTIDEKLITLLLIARDPILSPLLSGALRDACELLILPPTVLPRGRRG